jgi:1,4-dihydroxy-2-naphthoate polyprenyltransferase
VTGSVLGQLPRLVRLQFAPVMIAPVVLGAAAAWHSSRSFSLGLFLLALAGSVSLLLAANAVDDAYDFTSGTDVVSDRLSPPDSPGWKPIPRGRVSVPEALGVSYFFYGLAIAAGAVLSLLVGWPAIVIAAPGILLSYFYSAPPLKLDYRGLGLGEASIFLSFGPIPALGAYYVLTGTVSALPILVGVPSGLLTSAILVTHDLIFYDPYEKSGKRSAAVVLGKRGGALLATALAAAAYLVVGGLIAVGAVPPAGALAFLALPLFAKFADFKGAERTPPEYGSRTGLVFAHSCAFTLLLALGLMV